MIGGFDLFKSGGIETSIRNLALTLAQRGVRVEVLTFENTESSREWLHGVVLHTATYKKSRLPVLLNRNMSRACVAFIESRDYCYDEIWLRNLRPALYLTDSLKTPKIKYIIPGMFYEWSEENLQLLKSANGFQYLKWKLIQVVFGSVLYRQELKVLIDPAIQLYAYSRNFALRIQTAFPLGSKPIHPLKPGVSSDYFQEKARDFVKLSLQFPSVAQRYIFYCGRISPLKRLEVLIQAMSHLPEWQLVCAGECDPGYHLALSKKNKRGANSVVFLGKQSEYLPLLYACAEMTVLPSFNEPFGLVLIESLATGTPLVAFGGASAHTAASEIMVSPNMGRLVMNNSVSALAQSMRSLIELEENEKSLNRISNRAYIQKHYGWEQTVQTLLNT